MDPRDGQVLDMDAGWAFGMNEPWLWMGPPWQGWDLGMDGPAWALGMGERWVGMGPGHGWALGMDMPGTWMCAQN